MMVKNSNVLMDTLRATLWFSLAGLLVWLMHAWHQDYPLTQQLPIQQNTVPAFKETELLLKPSLATVIPADRQITFETDVIKGVIDKQGGDLVYLELLQHADSLDDARKPTHPFVLLDHSAHRYYIAQTDLTPSYEGITQKDKPLYHSDRTSYKLSSDQESLCLALHRKDNDVTITKQFKFIKGQYQIDVNYKVNNQGKTLWRGYPYAQLKQRCSAKGGWFSNTPYQKAIISSDKKRYEQIPLDKIDHQRLPHSTRRGWLSFSEPYFTSSWISRLPEVSYYGQSDAKFKDTYVLGLLGNRWEVSHGETQEGTLSLYVGPKSIKTLKASAKYLDRLVDYGMFRFIAVRLLWLLEKLQAWCGNWGWPIIGLAILIKLCFYPISAKNIRSTRAMQRVQPQINALKARYKDDPYRRMQAESEFYKREKISRFNALMLLQIPIFLAISAMFGESIEFRHQPFLWLKDLSAPDPYHILAILFALMMFIGSRFGVVGGTSNVQNQETQITIAILTGVIFTIIPISSGLLLYLALQQSVLARLEEWWVLGAPLPKVFRSSNKR